MWFTNIFLVLSVINSISSVNNNHHISKRYLLFSRYTEVQFSTGLTVPLVLPRRSINFSLVAQANYAAPYNISNFQPLTISARNKPFIDITRKTFYGYIIQFLDSYGLEGKECLLRSICEISEIPMHMAVEETLLEKIVHFVFTPSLEFRQQNGTNGHKRSFTQELLLAERIGKEEGDCSDVYSDCIVSIVDLFTAKYI
ncbi:unnamed protein product, partial [Phaedon cochleariae]